MKKMGLEIVPVGEIRRTFTAVNCVGCGNGTVTAQVYCSRYDGGKTEWVFTGFNDTADAIAFARLITRTKPNKTTRR